MPQQGSHSSNLQDLPRHISQFNYYNYMESWMKIFYQNETFSHSWFIQFDHKFESKIPPQFIRWWDQHGPTMVLLPESLRAQLRHYEISTSFINGIIHVAVFPQFISKYEVPWILKWQCHITSTVIETIFQSSPTSSSTAVVN